MKHILFATEKFNENGGQSNIFNHLFETCDKSELFTKEHIYMDEVHNNKQNINEVLISTLEQFHNKFDAVFFFFLGCNYVSNPKSITINYLYRKFPKPLFVFCWWDTAHPCIQDYISKLDKYAAFQLGFDGVRHPQLLDSFIAPASERLFYPDNQIYDVSFIGRTIGFSEREVYLEFLKQKGIKVQVCGGYKQDNFSAEEYARFIRQSKINLNFCYTPLGWAQAKGRVHEVIASQSLLLESNGPITSQYYIPNRDYVLFSTPNDLLQKIKYFLNNPEERQKIAIQGYYTYLQKYHHRLMWDWIYQQL